MADAGQFTPSLMQTRDAMVNLVRCGVAGKGDHL
jgi:hypothetical protein